jgi:N-acetyl-gamma-glutamyl-phosphate reductase
MNTSKKIKVGVIGGAGYAAGELIRLLLLHPHVEMDYVYSKSQAGNLIHDTHTDLIGDTDLRFTDTVHFSVDLIFLCVGHGASKTFLSERHVPEHLKIIDLSQDFRWNDEKFVYGLPELHREKLGSANYVANPGCFATAIQLALLPLAKNKALQETVHVNATTGSTGAGQSLAATSHFSWRNNNLSVYKAFEHQHLFEIRKSISELQREFDSRIHFIPQRGSFARGIQATVYTNSSLSQEEIKTFYSDFYKEHPFVHLSEKPIDLKQVVNTNKCLLYISKHEDVVLVTSVIDNLLKGASGQAVQNMNLMFGLHETSGLKLKSIAF